ncbi:MAG: hypothetical protein PHX08_22895 [Lachnospiraceae bacterium]|nr:hypothetical protein [Lachnospiraceae bacterium]
MNELNIKRHSFDLAKNRLKEFSEKNEAESAIDRVKTNGGIFGLGDHKVTGDELNNRLESIQGHLIDIYTHLKDIDSIWDDLSTVKKEVTDLFKAVDDSNKVIQEHQIYLERLNSASEKHQDGLDKLFQNQDEIKEYAEANRSSIAELQVFRSEVDSTEHIADIDSMWEQGNNVKTDLAEAKKHIVSLREKTIEIDKQIADKTTETQDKLVLLETKLKYAYYIAGGALGLAIVELMLALTGVI